MDKKSVIIMLLTICFVWAGTHCFCWRNFYDQLNRPPSRPHTISFDSLVFNGSVPFEFFVKPFNAKLLSNGDIYINDILVTNSIDLVGSVLSSARDDGLFSVSDEVLEWKYDHFPKMFSDDSEFITTCGEKQEPSICLIYNKKRCYEFMSSVDLQVGYEGPVHELNVLSHFALIFRRKLEGAGVFDAYRKMQFESGVKKQL
jgi:hypothetical protein